MPHTLFYAFAGVLMLAAALALWVINRCWGIAEARAAQAESEAALSYSKGYREATDEINMRREHEAKISYDKGFENGWNSALYAFEQNATVISGGGNKAKSCAAA